MIFDDIFTTYRRTASAGQRSYSSTASVTEGYGTIVPLDGALKATLDIDNSVKAYLLKTEETDVEIDDKFVIDSANYYVKEVEIITLGGMELTSALLYKK